MLQAKLFVIFPLQRIGFIWKKFFYISKSDSYIPHTLTYTQRRKKNRKGRQTDGVETTKCANEYGETRRIQETMKLSFRYAVSFLIHFEWVWRQVRRFEQQLLFYMTLDYCPPMCNSSSSSSFFSHLHVILPCICIHFAGYTAICCYH